MIPPLISLGRRSPTPSPPRERPDQSSLAKAAGHKAKEHAHVTEGLSKFEVVWLYLFALIKYEIKYSNIII